MSDILTNPTRTLVNRLRLELNTLGANVSDEDRRLFQTLISTAEKVPAGDVPNLLRAVRHAHLLLLDGEQPAATFRAQAKAYQVVTAFQDEWFDAALASNPFAAGLNDVLLDQADDEQDEGGSFTFVELLARLAEIVCLNVTRSDQEIVVALRSHLDSLRVEEPGTENSIEEGHIQEASAVIDRYVASQENAK